MTSHLGLNVHFSFQKNTKHHLDVGVGRAWLGTRTLHTQGALDGGGQFNNRSVSQKRKSWLVE